MPIGIQYGDPAAIGAAAFRAGLGEYGKYQDQLALRQDALELDEARFAEQQEQNDFRSRLAVEQLGLNQYNQDRAFRYGAYQDENNRLLQQQRMAQQEQHVQAGLAERQMQLEAQGNQQGMLAQRDQMQILAHAERDRQNRLAKQAAADWNAIQDGLANRIFRNDAQYQQAIQSWQDKYSSLGSPPPVQMPFQDQPSVLPVQEAFADMFGIEASSVPVDPETGEWHVEPRVFVDGQRIRQQQKQDEWKREKEQRELELEQERQQQEAVSAMREAEREAVESGFEDGNARTEQVTKNLRAMQAADEKFILGQVASFEKMDPEKRGDKNVRVPEGARLSLAVANYLKDQGYLVSGTRVYIDGSYIEVE